jgi:hypothetical protein
MGSKDTSQSQIMQAHIAACKLMGLTVVAYCSQHQIKLHQYYYWQKKLQPPQQDSNFIKMAPLLSTAGVSIVFVNGHQINFTMLPPVDYVKQLTR